MKQKLIFLHLVHFKLLLSIQLHCRSGKRLLRAARLSVPSLYVDIQTRLCLPLQVCTPNVPPRAGEAHQRWANTSKSFYTLLPKRFSRKMISLPCCDKNVGRLGKGGRRGRISTVRSVWSWCSSWWGPGAWAAWTRRRPPSWGCHRAGPTPRRTPPARTWRRPASLCAGGTPAPPSAGGSRPAGGSAAGPGGCPGPASPSVVCWERRSVSFKQQGANSFISNNNNCDQLEGIDFKWILYILKVMSDVDFFFADIWFTDIVQLLLSDTDTNRYQPISTDMMHIIVELTHYG